MACTGWTWTTRPRHCRWARKHTRPLKEVPIEEAYAAVPGLGAGFQRAVYMSGVANVRNPRLARSLRASLQQFANLELHEQTEVRGWLRDGDRVVGVATSRGEIRGDKVLLAAGAWSGELLKPLGLELPVVPVKGQMILYKCAADFLPRMVLAKGRYAIPRRDGHILIGSTLEHSGFDKTPTDEALESLRASAAELLPELADMQPVAHWAGLRPGSRRHPLYRSGAWLRRALAEYRALPQRAGPGTGVVPSAGGSHERAGTDHRPGPLRPGWSPLRSETRPVFGQAFSLQSMPSFFRR